MKKENTPIIKTKRLILRKFTKGDQNDLFLILSDKETNTFLPWATIETLEQTRKHLYEHFLYYYEKTSAYRYAICLKENNRPIGYVYVSNNSSNDMGYGLRKKFWNKCFTTEACIAVVKHLKNTEIPYITATHDINNPRSGAVMKKIGMPYRYSYVELWQPKNIMVTFRMYQLNLDGINNGVYTKYWDKYPQHFIETGI